MNWNQKHCTSPQFGQHKIDLACSRTISVRLKQKKRSRGMIQILDCGMHFAEQRFAVGRRWPALVDRC